MHLFGHSLGAWIAYELLAELLRRGDTPPLLLIVSGMRAPHMSAAEHDADREAPAIAHLDTPAFWAHFERRYGLNPDLADPLAREFVLPLLRADFAMLEAVTTLTPSPSPPRPSSTHLLCFSLSLSLAVRSDSRSRRAAALPCDRVRCQGRRSRRQWPAECVAVLRTRRSLPRDLDGDDSPPVVDASSLCH